MKALALAALFAAFGALAALPAKQPLPHADATKMSASADQRGTEHAPFVVNVKSVPPPTQAELDEKAAERQEKADSDRWLVRLTGALAIFTALLSAVTTFLWLSTRRLVIGTEDTAKRQLRAYLMVDEVAFQTTDGETRFMVVIKNFGQVPARHTVFWADKITAAVHEEPALSRGTSLDLKTGAIAPGADHTISCALSLIPDDFEVHSGKKVFFIFGAIQYHDGFQPGRVTTFKYMRTGKRWLDDGKLTRCETGNDAT